MDTTNQDVSSGSSPEEVTETEVDTQEDNTEEPTPVADSEVEKTPVSPAPVKTEEKTVPYSRFKEINDQLAELKKNSGTTKSLEVDDFIGISASLEGLDAREKQYLAEQHKLTGRPLAEIRKDEDFLLWQDAYQRKVEKERALKPSGTQGEEDRPKGLTERLRELNTGSDFKANLAEKEKLLQAAGMWKSPTPNPHRRNIG